MKLLPFNYQYTTADLEAFANGLVSELLPPGVQGSVFDSGCVWMTLLQAAVDQKPIKPVTDSTLGTYCGDHTFAQPISSHWIPSKRTSTTSSHSKRR